MRYRWKERIYIDSLIVYALRYEFSNDFDARSDFGKFLLQKKLVRWNHSYLKYALVTKSFSFATE